MTTTTEHCGDTCGLIDFTMAVAGDRLLPEERMKLAIEAVTSKKMSQRAAAKKYDVARRTIERRLNEVAQMRHPTKTQSSTEVSATPEVQSEPEKVSSHEVRTRLRALLRQHDAPRGIGGKNGISSPQARGWLKWAGISIPPELDGKTTPFNPTVTTTAPTPTQTNETKQQGLHANDSLSVMKPSNKGFMPTILSLSTPTGQEKPIRNQNTLHSQTTSTSTRSVNTSTVKSSNQTAQPISNVQSNSLQNSTSSAQMLGTGVNQSLGDTATGHTSVRKSKRSTALSASGLRKQLMSFFGKALLSKSQQPLSADRLVTVRGMTSLVMTTKEKAVYKGAEMDDWVRRPDLIVKHLKNAGLLPKHCYVVKVELPGQSHKKSALFGVKFMDLAKRQQAIIDYVDTQLMVDPDGKGISPVTGEDTIKLLGQLVAHGHVYKPEMISNDALLQGLCLAIKNPAVYKALVSGGADGMTTMIKAMKGVD